MGRRIILVFEEGVGMVHRRRERIISQAGLVLISGLVLLLCLFYTYAGVFGSRPLAWKIIGWFRAWPSN